MHEMIREYAVERLDERGETTELRRSHAEHYLALAEHAEPELRGRNQDTWLERIQQQHANFTTAIEFLVDDAQVEPALRLGAKLARYWERRGWVVEGRALLERALAEESRASPEVRAQRPLRPPASSPGSRATLNMSARATRRR